MGYFYWCVALGNLFGGLLSGGGKNLTGLSLSLGCAFSGRLRGAKAADLLLINLTVLVFMIHRHKRKVSRLSR